MAEKLKIPSFLNYNRSISPSEGLMYGVMPAGGPVPVEVLRRTIRGSISNYSGVYKSGGKADSADNIAKQFDVESANVQEIDVAYLPEGAEALMIRFSLVVQGNSLSPSGCNDKEFYGKLSGAAAAYRDKGGFDYLAERYAWNVINGRALWRNRFASQKSVTVEIHGGETLKFNTDNMSLVSFDRDAMPEGFDKLSAAVGKALAGGDPMHMTVSLVGYMPMGAEVYPSQEFLSEKAKKDHDGKVLSSIPSKVGERAIRWATVHSQKIGNAIRVIDEWHGDIETFGATPVEAYGYVQSRSAALRTPTGSKAKDVYALLKELDDVASQIASSSDAKSMGGDVHYLMAMLVRGGVFSGEKK